ncbi:hypothetical protein SNE35_20350 [Paucibacter sp. R3-3]|uniref:DUF4148 domain-containing protein n=1 Tax=Roseateles agri TaxID=3098619 RepID=A0ABU5DKN8_9BURK|nr:DUF4148 domain-containing protein [Paucibacter sp. R3-3]MDY0746875.1 hypothetical protein [Paucibacter sp. R3-3]
MNKLQPFQAFRLLPNILLTATMSSALMGALVSVAWADPAPAGGAQALTRAEVSADLQAYEKSGLADIERDDSQFRLGTNEWSAARARYLALRHIPSNPAADQPLTRQQVRADLALYQESGLAVEELLAGDASEETPALLAARARYDALSMPGAMAARALSRAEVEADLQIYKESGLADLERADGQSADIPGALAAARARYQALRANGRYQQVVQQLRKGDGQPG